MFTKNIFKKNCKSYFNGFQNYFNINTFCKKKMKWAIKKKYILQNRKSIDMFLYFLKCLCYFSVLYSGVCVVLFGLWEFSMWGLCEWRTCSAPHWFTGKYCGPTASGITGQSGFSQEQVLPWCPACHSQYCKINRLTNKKAHTEYTQVPLVMLSFANKINFATHLILPYLNPFHKFCLTISTEKMKSL